MNNCPKCGALVSNEQDKCTMCGAYLNNNKNEIKKEVPTIPDENEKNNEIKTTSKLNDEDKKNVMSTILQEHEEKTKPVKKDDSYKATILSIIVVILIIVVAVIGVYYITPLVNSTDEKILDNVASNAKDYTIVLENYMKRYDYKSNLSNQSSYVTRTRTYNFYSIPASGKCVLKDGKWQANEEYGTTCEEFFNDINNNYCHSITCNIPSEAEIYLKEELTSNETAKTVITGKVLDGTTLIYGDVTCSLTKSKYNCKYKK